MSFKKNIKKFRVLLFTILTFVIIFLFMKVIVPFGEVTYYHDFIGDDKMIGRLSPNDRVNNGNSIIGDPAYFSLYTPRAFDTAKITLEYENEGNKIVELGVLVDRLVNGYDLKPIENNVIDELYNSWFKIEEDGLLFLQKQNTFSNIKEFLSSDIKNSEVALYNYDLRKEYLIENYRASIEKTVISNSLRGPHQIYVYVKDQGINLTFDFFDLNRNKDRDDIYINLYYNNQIIASDIILDDGVKTSTFQESEIREFNLNVPNLPEGVYKVEIRVNDDIVIKKIEGNHDKISFLNRVWLYNSGNKNINLFTDNSNLKVTTINPDSLQSINFGDKIFSLDETYKQFNFLVDSTSNSIHVNKDGVILETDGTISFKKEQFMNPGFKKVSHYLNLDNIEYILADYTVPSKKDGYIVSEAEFSIKDAYREDRKYRFVVSVPELKGEDDKDDYLKIRKVTIKLTGKTLFSKIKEILRR